MKNFSTVFNQILQFLPHYEFEKAVKQFKTDHYVKHFTTKTLFVVHLYSQIRQKDSLRDILCGLRQNQSSWCHIGIKKIARSTISDSNNRITYKVYESLFYQMLNKCQTLDKSRKFKFKNNLYALDGSTIDLCLSVFDWAKFRKRKGGVKLHCLYDIKAQIPAFNVITIAKTHEAVVAQNTDFKLSPDSIITFDRAYIDFRQFYAYEKAKVFFVTRAKENLRFEFLGQQETPHKKGLQFDHIVQIASPKQREKYPSKLRLIGYWDSKTNKTYQFLTNNFKLAAITIALIYKSRWDIELFFKWIKQNLKIKSFLGTSKNAVLSQIWIAMTYFLLLAYLKHQTKFTSSILVLTRIFNETLFSRSHLIDLLGFNSVNSQNIRGHTQLVFC